MSPAKHIYVIKGKFYYDFTCKISNKIVRFFFAVKYNMHWPFNENVQSHLDREKAQIK